MAGCLPPSYDDPDDQPTGRGPIHDTHRSRTRPSPPSRRSPGRTAPGRRRTRPAPRALWGWALAAGVLAGLASWAGGERIFGAFGATPQAVTGRLSQSPEVTERSAREQVVAHTKEGAATYGNLGAATGLALGLAAGLSRRDVRASLVAAGAGLVLGGAAGAVAGLGMVRVFYQNEDLFSHSLIYPMLAHGAVWSAIGVAGGMAFGIGLGGRGRIARAASGGLLGAIGATVVYELTGALAFPLARTHFPIPESPATHLLAHLAVSLLVAAGAANGVRNSRANAASG